MRSRSREPRSALVDRWVKALDPRNWTRFGWISAAVFLVLLAASRASWPWWAYLALVLVAAAAKTIRDARN